MASPNHILLVHPLGYAPELATADVSRMANIMPPLGLASIAAVLDQNKISNAIIDCHCHPDSHTLIMDYIKKKSIGFIGFSCTTSSFLDGIRIAKQIKQVNPEIRTVFGGPHASALRESLMETFEVIDYLIIGEGEVALTELLFSLGKNLDNIPGLVFRDAPGRVKFTGFRKNLLDMDSLPFPAYKKLAGYPGAYKLPIFNYPKAPNSTVVSHPVVAPMHAPIVTDLFLNGPLGIIQLNIYFPM
ncbi:MAG: cobalamin-dependent protein [Thermodesulfobacteriota bacterium]|nr:cobalamin-dependent protein [Thermodesulfobacteriota bacterium]